MEQQIGRIDFLRNVNKDFEQRIGDKANVLDIVKKVIDERTQNITDLGERAIARYEIEYANGAELEQLVQGSDLEEYGPELKRVLGERCNYSYWSPLMDETVFAGLTEIERSELNTLNAVVDVGAGSGDLLKTLIGWGVKPQNALGVDISPTSANRVREIGCEARTGRFEEVVSSEESFDLIFLSYFIDRDLDQRSTFYRAIQTLNSNGTLVLEGLFPCVPIDPKGQIYANPESTITRGESTDDDIALVIDSWNEIAQELGISLEVTKIGTGQREVYSRDGREELPSDVIIAKRVN